LKEIQDTWVFLGAPDESFGSTFGPGSTGWETLVYIFEHFPAVGAAIK